jgi:putative flippase GtrA
MIRRIGKKLLENAELKKFMRFQFTAVIATSIDFSVTIFLKEFYHVYYPVAVCCGAIAGAITAFSINRFWVFASLGGHPLSQGLRYLLVVAGSIFLNTSGTWLITEFIKLPYLISKASMALIVGFTYSYYFSKRFVFYA